MKFIFPILLTFWTANLAFSQTSKTQFVPRNIQKAYEKNTRSHDGLPGKNYWQNRAEYKIEVNINFENRMVSGQADIQYFNESPDSLRNIKLKLAHDLWKKGGQRAYDLAASEITDEGVFISSLSVAGKNVDKPNEQKSNTFLNLKLDAPLAPGQKIDLKIGWNYIAPKDEGAPRECVCDSTSWFLSYWYPQVAVYDDLHGWADAPYNGLQEMYNDFSNYEVRVNVPATVMVWATGELQNGRDLFQPDVFQKIEKAKTAAEPIKIFSPEDYAAKKPFFKNTGRHTYIYKASGVPDFAIGFSDHFLWDAASVVVDEKTGRRTFVSAAYDPKSLDYFQVCKIATQAIHLMSNYQPGYPFPYPSMTVFNGNDGMEFPMMCNDASTHPRKPTFLTAHEISHSYFPFMMGINEQYYAWMDEGWAAFFDVQLVDTIENVKTGRLRDYSTLAGTDSDMPLNVPTRHLSGQSYRISSYNRPAAAYFSLLDLLGYEKFHHCMTEYMDRWKGKHPMPFDFFNSWNAAAGQNLDWFWKPWFFEPGYPDLAISDVKAKRGKTVIFIENKGTQPIPVHLEILFEDGKTETIHKTAAVWKENSMKTPSKTILIQPKTVGTIKKISLEHRFVPDVNMADNFWGGR